MLLQEDATETKQLSQIDRSQLRVSLVQQMPKRMEETLLDRLFESGGQKKGLEESEVQKSESTGCGPGAPEDNPQQLRKGYGSSSSVRR